MEKSEKIKQKIAALLKKTEANGASEAEAATAMSVALKLMAEYGVSLKDIKENNSSAQDFSERHVNEGSKTKSLVDKFIATAIATYTDTKVYSSQKYDGFKETVNKRGTYFKKPKYISEIIYYGYSVDVELAYYIYQICDRAIETEWKKFSVTLPTGIRAKARISFQLGMALRLRDRLLEMKQTNIQETNGTSLIVLKKQLVEAAFKANSGVTIGKASNSRTRYNAGKVFEAGKQAAENVRFNRAVHDGPTGGVKLIA